MGNAQPVFVSRKVSVSSVKVMGKQQNHLKLLLADGASTFEAVAFNFGHLADKLNQSVLDVVFSLDENIWNGRTTLQLKVKDLRLV